jgi:hypothetical protein
LLEALVETAPVGIGKAEGLETITDPMGKPSGEGHETVEAESLCTVRAKWNKVCAGVELFNAEFKKLGKGDLKYREAISTTVVRIHDAIRETDAGVSLLSPNIG